MYVYCFKLSQMTLIYRTLYYFVNQSLTEELVKGFHDKTSNCEGFSQVTTTPVCLTGDTKNVAV